MYTRSMESNRPTSTVELDIGVAMDSGVSMDNGVEKNERVGRGLMTVNTAVGCHDKARTVTNDKSMETVKERELSQSVQRVVGHCSVEHEVLPKQDREYEATENPISVKEKLAERVAFWMEVIRAPLHVHVLGIIQSSDVIPFAVSCKHISTKSKFCHSKCGLC